MTTYLTEEEVADRAAIDVERVRTLARLGILVAGGDGERPYQLRDVMRVEVAGATERAGVSLEDLASAVRSGAISLGYLDSLPETRPTIAETGRELAARLGVPFDLMVELFGAFGLPVPEPDSHVREDDAFLYRAAATYLGVGFDPQMMVVAARVYADVFRRLAQFQVDLFHSEIERPYRDRGVPESQLLELAVAEVASKTSELGARLAAYLYDRHAETYQIQHRVEHAERALEEAGIHQRRVEDPPAIVFLDLTGYTALTEERGDEASADVAARLAAFVGGPTRRHGGHVVKWLGDGVELFFPEPAAAVRCSLELAGATRGAGLPPAHIGINAGPLVYREGDYYGRTVNIAARIAGVASADQVLVGKNVMEACRLDGLRFEPHGEHTLKGVSHPLTLYRAIAGS